MRCFAARRDGFHRGRRAGNDVTTGEDAVDGGLERLLVDLDRLPAGEIQRLAERQEVGDLAVEQLRDLGALADRCDNEVAPDFELGAADRLGAAAARSIWLAELHPQALERSGAAVLEDDPGRGDEELHLDALPFCLFDLHRVGGHLGASAAVHDLHVVRPEAQRRTRAVDRRVASAHHEDCAVDVDLLL